MVLSTKYIIGVVAVVVIGAGIHVTMSRQANIDEANLLTEETVTVATEDINTLDRETQNEYPEVVDNTMPSDPEVTNQVPVVSIHSEYSFDVDNKKELTNWADNVFIAKIIEKVGDKSRTRVPQTQYSAVVISRIKGTTNKQITINQSGVGYVEGKLFANEGDLILPKSETVYPDDIFLTSKGVYLFATGYDAKNNWYTVSAPPHDRELITADSTLSDAAVISLAKQNSRVQEFVNAARELGVLNEEWK